MRLYKTQYEWSIDRELYANSTGELARTCSGERGRERARPIRLLSIASCSTSEPQFADLRKATANGGWQRRYFMALHCQENRVPLLHSLKCKCRGIQEINRNRARRIAMRRANMAASWRQRNLRSRWHVRQYKEMKWESRRRHPRHPPINWRNSIRFSDNRHTQGHSQSV